MSRALNSLSTVLIAVMLAQCSPKTSEHLIYSPAGYLEYRGQTNSEGDRIGLWHKYTNEGQVREAIHYKKDSLFYSEIYSFLNPMRIEQTCEGYVDSQGKEILHGEHKSFHPNYALKSKTFYLYGEQNGESILMSDAGDTLRISNYLEGNLNDHFKEFYIGGQVKTEGAYENDYKKGLWKSYYENGNLKSEGRYSTGINIITSNIDTWQLIVQTESGDTLEVLEWNENVNRLETEYGPGFPIKVYHKLGSWQYWNEDGSGLRYELYQDGVLIKE